ncbi:MAG: kinase-like domain-containing protein, partial [Piptocephalis tieghemiana]
MKDPHSLVGRTLHLPSGEVLSMTDRLGHGAYGAVYAAQTLPSGHMGKVRHYAVKHLPDSHLTPAQRVIQRREALLHARCSSHPHVLTLHDVVEPASPASSNPEDDPSQSRGGAGWFLILERASGDLFDYITSDTGLMARPDAELVARHIFAQICSAVAYCHSVGVYHRDLKPENILLVHSPSSPYPQVRLADFGLATDVRIGADRGCGSTYYMAPEARRRDGPHELPYDPVSADVWALGVLLCNLAVGRNPWTKASMNDPGFAHYATHPSTGLAELLPLSPELHDILRQALFISPMYRCSVPELMLRV